jgi:flagellar export protein FliJ
MTNDLKSSLKRLERLVQIRDTYVAAAETSVKQAESEVRRLEKAEHELIGNIQRVQAEIAYLRVASGRDVQKQEAYIQALEGQRKLVGQSLEIAMSNLEKRRLEWTEAMREKKTVAKLQERRLLQWKREDDVAQQKLHDDAFITRYVRTRLDD